MWWLFRKSSDDDPGHRPKSRPDNPADRPDWMRFDPRTSSKAYNRQKPPNYAIGDQVRLIHKPARLRTILKIEWHRERSEWVYCVQHFKHPDDQKNPAYWFEDQLKRVET